MRDWNAEIERRLEGRITMRFGNQYARFEGLRPSELKAWMEEGLVQNDKHNHAPELKELADLPDEEIELEGYVIFQPRDDYRLSVDAVRVKKPNMIDERLLDRWAGSADIVRFEGQELDAPVYFWWD